MSHIGIMIMVLYDRHWDRRWISYSLWHNIILSRRKDTIEKNLAIVFVALNVINSTPSWVEFDISFIIRIWLVVKEIMKTYIISKYLLETGLTWLGELLISENFPNDFFPQKFSFGKLFLGIISRNHFLGMEISLKLLYLLCSSSLQIMMW